MSMGCCRLGLAVVASFGLLVALTPEPASANGALALASMHAGASVRAGAALASPVAAGHFRRTQSFYCYPRNYWWFYRPYTTGLDGHPRCMPYFHYLEPTYDGGARPNRYIK